MLKIKKVLICLFILCNVLAVFHSDKVYAAFSKSEYENGFLLEMDETEDKTISFKVTNLNDVDVEDIELALEVPEGYKIDNAKSEVDTLKINESVELTAKVEKDYTKVYFIVFGTIAIVVFFLVIILIISKKRKSKNAVVAVLCIMILGNHFSALAVSKKSNDSCRISYNLNVNHEEVKVVGRLSYDVFDTDSDGLPDKIEKEIGTDKKKEDTDEDGFTDYEEYALMGTDPLEANSQEKDADGDGLSDYDEIKEYNTDVNNKDSDFDGLTDYEEVKEFSTDSNQMDTDGDTLSDGFEIEHDLDPLKTSSDGKKKDKELLIEQEISKKAISSFLLEEDGAVPNILGKAKGEMANNIYLSAYHDTAVDDNHAILGKAVLIEAEDSYVDGLTLSFDVSGFEGNKNILSLCKLNEDGTYEVLDSELEDDDLQIKLETSGVYFVMDEEFFMRNLGIDVSNVENKVKDSEKKTELEKEVNLNNNLNLKYLANDSVTLDVSGQADIVFVIDTTGSMSGAIRNVKENVTNFAQSLKDNYNVNINYSLIEYKDIIADGKDSTKIVKKGAYNWFVNTSDFIDVVEKLNVGGGGDVPESAVDALEMARNLDFRPTASKYIILVTDANYKEENNYQIESMEEEIGLLSELDITTSVVSKLSYEETYRDLYESKNGIFADIDGDFSTNLLSIADVIGEKTADGEWVILKHGYRFVKLGTEEDSDGDGIPDLEELGKKEEIEITSQIQFLLKAQDPDSRYDINTKIVVYNAKSDPTKADTDGDGIGDAEDEAPWTFGLKNGVIGSVKIMTAVNSYLIEMGSFKLVNLGGHAWLVYQSYVNDTIDLQCGVLAHGELGNFTFEECSQIPCKIGDLVGFGTRPDNKFGTEKDGIYINFDNNCPIDRWGDYYTLTHTVTASQLQRLISFSRKHDDWTQINNCSYYASKAWDFMFCDSLKACKGTISDGIIYTPRILGMNMKHRDGFEINDGYECGLPDEFINAEIEYDPLIAIMN